MPELRFAFAFAALSVALSPCVPAAVTTKENSHFIVNFYNAGDNFSGASVTSDADWTADRITQTLAATQLWVDTIANPLTTSKINVNLVYTDFGADGNRIIGSSRSRSTYIEREDLNYTRVSMTEQKWKLGIQYGPPSWNTWDIFIRISTGFEFSDNGFTRVLVHEIGHAFGVSSYLYSNEIRDSDYNKWDSLLVDANGNSLATSDDYNTRSSILGKQIFLSDGNDRVQVYNPTTYSQGSSFAHPTDGSLYNTTNSIFNYAGNPYTDLPVEFSELDLRTLRLLGWSVIPEPSAFGLLAGTLALVLTATRRRRRRSPRTAGG